VGEDRPLDVGVAPGDVLQLLAPGDHPSAFGWNFQWHVGKRVKTREVCNWPHSWQRFKRVVVGTNGNIECNLLARTGLYTNPMTLTLTQQNPWLKPAHRTPCTRFCLPPLCCCNHCTPLRKDTDELFLVAKDAPIVRSAG
jgi:hypothetical protein